MVVGLVVYPDSKVHVAHMGPTWVLLAPGGSHVGPMNLAIRVGFVYLANFSKEALLHDCFIITLGIEGRQDDWQASVPIVMPVLDC